VRNPQFLLDHRFARRRLSAYADGELGTTERRRIERHIDECPDCALTAQTLPSSAYSS
jgi:anti-sigma factor RsiW